MNERLQRVEHVIRGISSAYQSVRIYSVTHRSAQAAIGFLFDEIRGYLADHGELSFAIAEGEIFSGKDVFFELSRHLAEMRAVLTAASATRVTFLSAFSRQDLQAFFSVLVGCVDGKTFVDAAAEQRAVFSGLQVGVAGGSSDVHRRGSVAASSDMAADLAEILYGKIATQRRTAEDALAGGLPVDVASLLNFSYDLYHAVLTNRESLFAMMGVKRHDDYTFVHSVNVAVLTVFQAQYLGLDEKTCARLGLAGMLHDTGKTAVKQQILNSREQLTDEEFRTIKSHAVVGAEILLAGGHTDAVLLLGAYQHHMGVDLSRYPRPVFIRRQSVAAKIIAVADIYDALRSRRSYKEGMAPDKVYEIMMKEKGRQLDPELVDLFFKHMGVWPAGTLVKLDGGEVAVVKEVNVDDIFSPVVEVHRDADGERTGKPYARDLKEKAADGAYLSRIAAYIAPESDEGKVWTERLFGEKKKTDGAEGGI